MDEFARIIEENAKPESFDLMWTTAKDFLERGYPREELLNQLRNIVGRFRELDLQPEEDIVLELMDCFYGWCSPDTRL
jgi:hypothetical protein